ncbi:centromere protein Chl4/mis15/CENP-N [Dipodascopsis tothii]|uniref:centromere protein Chl4/mis15/CENP-N n=1 Tax=Dipodascopsis tothii TaxID=44089 RepID=UPI0034CE1374
MSPAIVRPLLRLRKDAVVRLVARWLADDNEACHPWRQDDDDDAVEPQPPRPLDPDELAEVRDAYAALGRTAGSRRAIVDRVAHTDWYRGLNLRQLAEIDCQHIFDRGTAVTWTASRAQAGDGAGPPPVFQARAFADALGAQLAPLMAHHIYVTEHPTLPLAVVRVVLHDAAAGALTRPPTFRDTVYCAVPSGAPTIFHSALMTPAQRMLRECIEHALSRPGRRVELVRTSLSARSLESLLTLRGPGRHARALGGWAVYADDKVDASPLAAAEAVVAAAAAAAREDARAPPVERARRRRAREIDARLGAARPAAALERATFELDEEADLGNGPVRVRLRIALEGADVFGGIRELAHAGVVDAAKVPPWLAGEHGVSSGTIRDGRLVQ